MKYSDDMSDPYVCRPIAISELDSNFILESVLRRYGIKLEDKESMHVVSEGCDVCWLVSVMDCASTNHCSLQYICWYIGQYCPLNLIQFPELCGEHGTHLTKGRWPVGKCTAAALCSLSCFMRDQRANDAVEIEVANMTPSESVTVMRGTQPEEHVDLCQKIILSLFSRRPGTALWKDVAGSPGETSETQLYLDMMGLLSVISFKTMCCMLQGDPRVIFAWVHWCYTLASDASVALPVGSACCREQCQALLKVRKKYWISVSVEVGLEDVFLVGPTSRNCYADSSPARSRTKYLRGR